MAIRILFLSQIAGRKRICDRHCPGVVNGCDIRGKEKEGAAWTSGEFDFDVFLRPRGSSGRPPRRIFSMTPLGPPTMPPCVRPHVCFAYIVYTQAILPPALVASAPSVCTESAVPHRSLWAPMRFRLKYRDADWNYV